MIFSANQANVPHEWWSFLGFALAFGPGVGRGRHWTWLIDVHPTIAMAGSGPYG
jgi:hypothetical protein